MKYKLEFEKFNHDLRYTRMVSRRLSMDDVARQTGISKATISRAEKGCNIEISTFLTLCGWMWMNPSDYITEVLE